ncbi:hypothetical protein [Dyadobacter sp. CY343]|uniref:hypothetical protein n=1 Tax=Dyadobacter sp. CY343 TaxID=2907299 RepID=UPI001F3EE069|nr:hypothetical protein [Dyadobacter sp. CY343]
MLLTQFHRRFAAAIQNAPGDFQSCFLFAAGMITASMHDSCYIPFLKCDDPTDCELLADRRDISACQQLALFKQAGVKIITPVKANMKIKTYELLTAENM